MVGDHQFYPGYALLLLKRHVRELHELPPAEASGLYDEVMRATMAVVKAYDPWKMNHLCLGNVDQHVHWHLMPRYASEPHHPSHPFRNQDKFAAAMLGEGEARAVAARLKAAL